MALISNKQIWMVGTAAVVVGLGIFLMRDADRGGDDEAAKAELAARAAAEAPGEDESEEGGMGRAGVTDNEVKPWYPNASKYEPSIDDVQQWDWLQQDLDLLIDKARPKEVRRVEPDELKHEYVTSTMGYLELDDKEAAAFEAAVDDALATITAARQDMATAKVALQENRDDPSSTNLWRQSQLAFGDSMDAGTQRLLEALPERSRTTMMRENSKRWLARLDFGIQHAGRPKRR